MRSHAARGAGAIVLLSGAIASSVYCAPTAATAGSGARISATSDAPSLSGVLMGSHRAPLFTARTLDAKRLDLTALERRGPVLLDFWATWCEPCVASLRELEGIQRRYLARGLTVVGISADGPRNFSKVRPFVSRFNLTFPIVLDEDGSLQERYQVRSMPTSFLIDSSGHIVHVEIGYRPGANDEVESAIRALSIAASEDSSVDSSRVRPRAQ